jgi:protein gp37
MSKETKIEWADSTLNFWSGCTKVSAGCAHCYAESFSNRKLGNIGGWGKGAARKRHQSAFNLALQLNQKPWVCEKCGAGHANKPNDKCGNHYTPTDYHEQIMCRGQEFHRRRVFSLSLGDWLDPEVPIEWLAEMLDTIRRCDQLQWLLVTKRPELWSTRLREVLDLGWKKNTVHSALHIWVADWQARLVPRKNVMVLTSVENQQAADERIPALLKIPAAQRGLSCEPLLGPVDLASGTGQAIFWRNVNDPDRRIDWVIAGGESGPGARACNVDWLFDIKDQCAEAGVPCFIKQFGAKPVYTAAGVNSAIKRHWNDPSWFISWNSDHNAAPKITDKKGGDITEWPLELRVREFPEVL